MADTKHKTEQQIDKGSYLAAQEITKILLGCNTVEQVKKVLNIVLSQVELVWATSYQLSQR